MAAKPVPVEIPKETGLKVFDDYKSYQEMLKKTMDRADEILAMQERGMTPAEQKLAARELPSIVAALRQLLDAQMEKNGMIAEIDMADGSYDNADIDDKLRIQLGKLRNMNTDMHRRFGSRTERKVQAWFREDIRNWFGVKWRQFKDNMKHFLITAGVVGGLTAGGVIGGYALYHGGLLAGLGALKGHLGILSKWVGAGIPVAGSYMSGAWNTLFGKKVPAAAVEEGK
ncbi:MAG: hypothetical protein Q7R81_05445 [Candidatus Peregrinibacteria bacterium]|nr:hypothetical protein [Candidatus Peregrinibacteria bacterium]